MILLLYISIRDNLGVCILSKSEILHIGKLLQEKNLHLVVAESCTGGLFSHKITNVPGSSSFYLGGVNTYSYESKRKLLCVSKETLDIKGAVSRETVVEMARGVRLLFSGENDQNNIIGVSISGIAGPGGSMPGKPVGLTWFGLSAGHDDFAWQRIWHGTRIQNKRSSVFFAIEILIDYLENQLPDQNY